MGKFLGPGLGSVVVGAVLGAVAVFALSFTLRGDRGDAGIRIDVVASLLIGAAIVLLTLGFNNLNGWGALAATEARQAGPSSTASPR